MSALDVPLLNPLRPGGAVAVPDPPMPISKFSVAKNPMRIRPDTVPVEPPLLGGFVDVILPLKDRLTERSHCLSSSVEAVFAFKIAAFSLANRSSSVSRGSPPATLTCLEIPHEASNAKSRHKKFIFMVVATASSLIVGS